MLDRPFSVKSCANAEFIGPTGKRTRLPVVQIGAFLACEFEPIINLVRDPHLSDNTIMFITLYYYFSLNTKRCH